ncbi:MAG: NB-ARC domain-containing protein [Cyanobacteria bacterium P01_C01_bin.72]
MVALKASSYGQIKISQARKIKGWKANDFRWLATASAILGVSWQKEGYLAEGISEGTWKRFLAGKYAVNADAFKAYCLVLGLNWQEIVQRNNYRDWGEAIDSDFFGRIEELSLLKRWIIQDNCRLITLLGMGGIGKTALAFKIAKSIEHEFEFIIWRSLRNSPTIDDLLADLIQFLSRQNNSNLPNSLDYKIVLLIKYLQKSRCLLILDNAESIINSQNYSLKNTRTNTLLFDAYSRFFKAIAQSEHQSCMIITSRIKIAALNPLESAKTSVRALKILGLSYNDAREILHSQGLVADLTSDWQTLVDCYEGNPLAIKVAAANIKELFAGNVSDFTFASRRDFLIFKDINDLLQQQFACLTNLEQQIMYWLAVNRKPVSIADLQQDLVLKVSPSTLLSVLSSLKRRSLIEKSGNLFKQQTVVLEYVTCKLIKTAVAEITTNQINIFNQFAVVKYQAEDYLRQTQEVQILQPLVSKLLDIFPKPQLIDRLNLIIKSLHTSANSKKIGYLTGNIINIFNLLKVDLSNYNLSGLTIWQANFQEIKLHNVNFTGADLAKSVFTSTLGNVLSAAFSPDGKIIATGDTDCQIRFWSVTTGQLLATCKGHTNWVRSIAFSPDGQTLISGSGDRTIKFWQVQDAVCIKTCRGHESEIFSVAYSLDGRAIASASGDNIIRIWDTFTAQCIGVYRGHTNSIRAVAFSSDGLTLASGSDDNTVRIWDIASQKCRQILTEHNGWIRSLAFSPIPSTSLEKGDKREILASGSGDRTIKLWSLDSNKSLATYNLHDGDVSAIAFSSDGLTLASGSSDRTVRLWNYHTHTCIRTIYGHTNQIFSLAFNPNGKNMVCVSLDRTVRLWSCADGKCLKTWHGNTDWVFPVAHSPQGNFIASGSNDRTVKLWNNQNQHIQTLSGHDDYICSLAFHPHQEIIASSSRDNTIKLWNITTGKCLQTISQHEDWIYSIAFSPDGNLLASGSADKTLRLWSVDTGERLQTPMQHPDTVWSVAFSPEGKTIATGNTDYNIRLWDLETAECINTLTGHSDRVLAVAFNPISDTRCVLASGSIDCTVKLWDVSQHKIIRTLVGHENWVFSVAFSPDGRILASGSHDGTVRIWDAETGKCLHICTGHDRLVSSVAFSPCGNNIISGSQDQTIRIWNAKTGKCLNVLRSPRLYEGTNITDACGLTKAQKQTLKTLGAVF